MLADLKLRDEPARQAALNRYQVLDSATERPFENIVSMVEEILEVPISAVSLVDADRQWFKAQRGLDVSETGRDVAFCHYAIQQSDPMIVSNAQEDPWFRNNPLVTGAPHIRAYAGAPLQTPDGFQIGTLCAIDTKPREFQPHEIKVLESFARLVVDELELRVQACSDVLTGAMTRRCWMNAAEEEIRRAVRNDEMLAVVMLDIDRFKTVNDTHGHPFGDKVIQAVANACQSALRSGSKLGRIGGEEFAILLTESNLEQAVMVAERCRDAIANLRMVAPNGDMVRPTASFGVAPLFSYTQTPEDLIESADKALYKAKQNGRNRVEVGQFAASAYSKMA